MKFLLIEFDLCCVVTNLTFMRDFALNAKIFYISVQLAFMCQIFILRFVYLFETERERKDRRREFPGRLPTERTRCRTQPHDPCMRS